MRYLIINADDFGYSLSVNKGIIEAMNRGVVTSTSVMVDGIGAEEASNLNKIKDISVGLHFFPKSLDKVEGEFSRQVDLFKKILGRKPDHVDTHKRLPTDVKEIEKVVRAYSEKTKTPVREFNQVNFIESFFGLNVDGSGDLKKDNVSIQSFKSALDQTRDGFNELMCHVGYSDDYLRENSSYNDIREEELKTLLSQEATDYLQSLQDIKLVNWNIVQKNIFT